MMLKAQYLHELVKLVVVIEKGMNGLDEPVSSATEKGLCDAIIGFGSEALQAIHLAFEALDYGFAAGCLPDILGVIGDESSIPYLITAHKQGDFLSGTAALQALRKLAYRLNSDFIYTYLADLLVEAAQGNPKVFNSTVEIIEACKAMDAWNNSRGLDVLKESLKIRYTHDMPRFAIAILVRRPEAQEYLTRLADEDADLSNLIRQEYHKLK